MNKQVYEVDDQGFMTYKTLEIEPITVSKEGEPIYVIPEGYVDAPLPSDENGQLPFYRPKWTGEEWVEDMPQEEIDEINNQRIHLSVEEQLAEKDRQILELREKQNSTNQMISENVSMQQDLLELLIEMGVI